MNVNKTRNETNHWTRPACFWNKPNKKFGTHRHCGSMRIQCLPKTIKRSINQSIKFVRRHLKMLSGEVVNPIPLKPQKFWHF